MMSLPFFLAPFPLLLPPSLIRQLLAKMDTQTMYVPLSALLTVAPVAALTQDPEALLQAVVATKSVVLDEQNQRVRPNHTVKRNTIILREVPEGSKEVGLFGGKPRLTVAATDDDDDGDGDHTAL
jgi:hypothetical protein